MDGNNDMSTDIPLPGPVFSSPIDTLYRKYGVSEAESRVISEEKEYLKGMVIRCRQRMNEEAREIIEKKVEANRGTSDSVVLSTLLSVSPLVRF